MAARDRIEKAQATPTGRADLETAKGIIFSKKIASNESIDAWAKDATERGDLHHKERIAYLMADLDQCALFFSSLCAISSRVGEDPEEDESDLCHFREYFAVFPVPPHCYRSFGLDLKNKCLPTIISPIAFRVFQFS